MPLPMGNIVTNVGKTPARVWRGLSAALCLCALLTACGAAATEVPAQAPTLRSPTITPSAAAANPAVATAPVTATPDARIVLIWWPSALYPGDESPTAILLRQQVAAYQSSQAGQILLRVKRAEGSGGIYQTLLSGSVAAPSAMPDLTLMRRSDLAQAANAKLIEPIDARVFSVDDVFASALALGQIRGVQYGIPYALEIQHVVYRSSVITKPPRTLDDVLQAGQPFLFPAGVTKGVNSTLLAQYLSAGGRIANEKGAPVLDRAPLISVLHFYELAVAAKVAGPQLLDYTTTAQYWSLFASGKASLVEIDSTAYLAQRATANSLPDSILPQAMPVPGDTALSALDTWMWVITTTDPDKQTRALGVLAWLMQADQQGGLLRELGVLPSRRSALERWGDDSYARFVRSLLEQGAVPPLDTVNPVVADALQKAFSDVLLGRKTAESAADDAVVQASSAK